MFSTTKFKVISPKFYKPLRHFRAYYIRPYLRPLNVTSRVTIANSDISDIP